MRARASNCWDLNKHRGFFKIVGCIPRTQRVPTYTLQNALKLLKTHYKFTQVIHNSLQFKKHEQLKKVLYVTCERENKTIFTLEQSDSTAVWEMYSQLHLFLWFRVPAACFSFQRYLNYPSALSSFLLACYTALCGHSPSTRVWWSTQSCRRAECCWFFIKELPRMQY